MQINVQLSQLATFLPQSGEFSKMEALLDLIRQAEHQEDEELPCGYLLTSVNALAGKWGWSRTKANNFLQELQDKDFIILQKPDKAGNSKFAVYVKSVQYIK